MTFQIAMVQPETHFGESSRQANLELAWQHAGAAVAQGASLVAFPESFPGQWRSPVRWTPEGDMRDLAKDLGVFVVAGFAEPLDDDGVRCYNTLTLIGPDGREVGRYRRTTPNHAPWVYSGGEYWDFEWVNANLLPVFDTDLGPIGLLMCSEVYGPELFRILALKGAELIVVPGGLIGPNSPLFETWRTLVWARAIENLCYVATSSNAVGDAALAMVCSPEHVIVEETRSGVFLAEVDLARVIELRGEVDRRLGKDTPWRTKPGVLRDWRRHEVLAPNASLLTEAFDATKRSP